MGASTFALSATPRQIAYVRSLALRNQTLLELWLNLGDAA